MPEEDPDLPKEKVSVDLRYLKLKKWYIKLWISEHQNKIYRRYLKIWPLRIPSFPEAYLLFGAKQNYNNISLDIPYQE